MILVGFEPTISAGERPQTYALDRAATGTGNDELYHCQLTKNYKRCRNNCCGVIEGNIAMVVWLIRRVQAVPVLI